MWLEAGPLWSWLFHLSLTSCEYRPKGLLSTSEIGSGHLLCLELASGNWSGHFSGRMPFVDFASLQPLYPYLYDQGVFSIPLPHILPLVTQANHRVDCSIYSLYPLLQAELFLITELLVHSDWRRIYCIWIVETPGTVSPKLRHRPVGRKSNSIHIVEAS